MGVMEQGAGTPLRLSGRGRAPEIAALHGALRTETRLAEALACRSRGLLAAVEALSARAFDEAVDIADARRRLDRLSGRMRVALETGEAARPEDLAGLVEGAVGVFETAESPRIGWEGGRVRLRADAARLLGLTLFDLASRSLRHGALGLPDGRVMIAWRLRPEGGLDFCWRECGAPPDSLALRGAVGGALLPLLVEQFGAPLRVRATPFGLRANLAMPERDLVSPGPARVVRLAAGGARPAGG